MRKNKPWLKMRLRRLFKQEKLNINLNDGNTTKKSEKRGVCILKKDGLKAVILTATGLLTAVLIYPFLHETGHSLAALSVGARVNEFTLLPLPSIVCEMSDVGVVGRGVVGFGGMLLPVFTAMLIPKRNHFLWYFRLLLLGISLLAAGISIVSVAFDVNRQDDMVQILNVCGGNKFVMLMILFIIFAYLLTIIIREKPFRRFLEYFCI